MKTTTNKQIYAYEVNNIESHNHTDEVIEKTTAFLNHLAGAQWTTSQIIQEAKIRSVQHKLQNYVLRLGWCTKPKTGVWLFDDFNYDPIHTRKVLDLATGYNSTIVKESKERKEKKALRSEQMRNAANKRWANERNKKSEQKKERKIKRKSSFVSKANLKQKFAEYKTEAKEIIGNLERFIKEYKNETKSKIKTLENFITKQETEITSLKTRLQDKTKEEGYEGAKKLGHQKAISLLNDNIDQQNEVISNQKLQNSIQAKKIVSDGTHRQNLYCKIKNYEKESAKLLKDNKELKAKIKTQAEELAKMEYISKESAKMCLDSENRMKELSNGNDSQKATPYKEINLFWGLLRIFDSK